MSTSVGQERPVAPEMGPLCSTWAREQNLDPIGTAGCYRGYLLVEWPLPWPRDLSEDPLLAPVARAARDEGMRLQGLVPKATDRSRHVIAYRWPSSRGARFERAELVVEPDEVVDAASAVLRREPMRDETVDVLVCTHGRRDRCCGSLGTVLANELQGDPEWCGDQVRLWRTSHTGGHRFAPTAVVLPQGTAWAFCDRSALTRIVRREGALPDLLSRYRGCSGLSSPAVQALERAVLAEVGWSLFDMAHTGAQAGETAELVVEDRGRTTLWEATVRVSGVTLVPDCGLPVELWNKTEPQFAVEGLRRRPGVA